jgi:hypothetical protein
MIAYGRMALNISAAALVVLVLAAVVRPQRAYEKAFAAQQAHGHETGIALVAGIEDADVIRAIFPDPPFVVAHLPAIRRKRPSIFAAGRQDWIGQPLSRVFRPASPSLCSGALETLLAVTGGYRAAGWASDRVADRPPRDVVLTDQRASSPDLERPDPAATIPITDGWDLRALAG